MAEDLIPQYVDLPALISEKRKSLWGQFGGVAFFVLLSIAGSIGWLNMPMSVWPMALAVSALVGAGFLMILTPDDIFVPVKGFDCPNDKCRKYVAADDTWICGHCDCLNKPERKEKGKKGSKFRHWLTQQCWKCSNRPSSYLCHYCGEIIFLSRACNGQHPARAAEKKYPAARTVDAETDWKAQIERMIAEKIAFSTITQKVCELRDAELKRIEEDQTIDRLTKGQLLEFEKQWANKKLQDLKMRVVKTK